MHLNFLFQWVDRLTWKTAAGRTSWQLWLRWIKKQTYLSQNLCVSRAHNLSLGQRGIISAWSWLSLSVVIAAGKRLRLWHTSCGPLVPSPPPSLTTSVTQTHAKQATVSTASHIQLQMSPLWAPAPFDVMNNEDEFSFTPVCWKLLLFRSLTASTHVCEIWSLFMSKLHTNQNNLIPHVNRQML